jgi:hypothetical protein
MCLDRCCPFPSPPLSNIDRIIVYRSDVKLGICAHAGTHTDAHTGVRVGRVVVGEVGSPGARWCCHEAIIIMTIMITTIIINIIMTIIIMISPRHCDS